MDERNDTEDNSQHGAWQPSLKWDDETGGGFLPAAYSSPALPNDAASQRGGSSMQTNQGAAAGEDKSWDWSLAMSEYIEDFPIVSPGEASVFATTPADYFQLSYLAFPAELPSPDLGSASAMTNQDYFGGSVPWSAMTMLEASSDNQLRAATQHDHFAGITQPAGAAWFPYEHQTSNKVLPGPTLATLVAAEAEPQWSPVAWENKDEVKKKKKRGRPRIYNDELETGRSKERRVSITESSLSASTRGGSTMANHSNSAPLGSGSELDQQTLVRARNKAAATRYRAKTMASIADMEDREHEAAVMRKELMACAGQLREEVCQLKDELLQQAGCGCPLIQGYLSGAAQQAFASLSDSHRAHAHAHSHSHSYSQGHVQFHAADLGVEAATETDFDNLEARRDSFEKDRP